MDQLSFEDMDQKFNEDLARETAKLKKKLDEEYGKKIYLGPMWKQNKDRAVDAKNKAIKLEEGENELRSKMEVLCFGKHGRQFALEQAQREQTVQDFKAKQRQTEQTNLKKAKINKKIQDFKIKNRKREIEEKIAAFKARNHEIEKTQKGNEKVEIKTQIKTEVKAPEKKTPVNDNLKAAERLAELKARQAEIRANAKESFGQEFNERSLDRDGLER